MPNTPQKDNARSRIYELLGDGKTRTTAQICAEVGAAHGYSDLTVRAALSQLRFRRGIERERVRHMFEYRRTDIGTAKAS